MKTTILLVASLCFTPQLFADAGEPSLKAVPDRCISLHRGQVCYQITTLSWLVTEVADYCLFQERVEKPLQCWTRVNNGSMEIDFQSAEPATYHLRLSGGDQAIASAILSLSWVYKSPKRQKQSWRLF